MAIEYTTTFKIICGKNEATFSSIKEASIIYGQINKFLNNTIPAKNRMMSPDACALVGIQQNPKILLECKTEPKE